MSDKKPRVMAWKRSRYLMLGGISTVIVGAAAGGLTLYVAYKFHHTEIVPATVHDIDGKYIYVDRKLVNQQVEDKIPVRVDTFLPELFPPARLLALRVEDPHRRRQIIDEITRRQWTDDQLYQIAQKAYGDPKLMVAIARSEVFNPKLLFRAARLKDQYVVPAIREELLRVLSACPTGSTTVKVARRKSKALAIALKKTWKFTGYLSFSGSPAETLVIRALVSGLSELSEYQECCVQMRKDGVVPVIARIVAEKALVGEDNRYLARILANVSANALDGDLVEQISRSGLLTALATWSSSSDLDLCLRASKALANLDMELDTDVYVSGVYLLHPLKLSKSEPVFDVVFVHGLRGGVLKTWRQNVKTLKDLQKNGMIVDEPYVFTQCWPKDWLSVDFPASRIIAIDYETSFVQSTFPMTGSATGASIFEARSADILQRLQHTGIGSRPIFWISHSMGGILVKQILLLAAAQPQTQNILDKTMGCVFYSTPHVGSPFADQMSRLFRVSPEVHDLRINNPYLLELQAKFIQLVEARRFGILSFGEMLPDYRIISTRFVPADSSNPRMGKFVELSDATHFVTCKPTNPRSAMYQNLVEFLREILMTYRNPNEPQPAQVAAK